jgi:hypothetical protein
VSLRDDHRCGENAVRRPDRRADGRSCRAHECKIWSRASDACVNAAG